MHLPSLSCLHVAICPFCACAAGASLSRIRGNLLHYSKPKPSILEPICNLFAACLHMSRKARLGLACLLLAVLNVRGRLLHASRQLIVNGEAAGTEK